MPRDESLNPATTPHPDSAATRLFELLTVADVAVLLTVSKSWVGSELFTIVHNRAASPLEGKGQGSNVKGEEIVTSH